MTGAWRRTTTKLGILVIRFPAPVLHLNLCICTHEFQKLTLRNELHIKKRGGREYRDNQKRNNGEKTKSVLAGEERDTTENTWGHFHHEWMR